MPALERRAKGLTGVAAAYATRVELVRKGPLAALGERAPERTVIPFSRLRGVVFEPAGQVSTGYVHFLDPGEQPDGGETGLTELVERARADDSVLFTRHQEPAFATLRDDVRRRLLDRDRDPSEQRLRERVLDGSLSEQRYRRRLVALAHSPER